jgi:hypothetical protein
MTNEEYIDEIAKNLGTADKSPEMQEAQVQGEQLAIELQESLGINPNKNLFDEEPDFDVDDLLFRYRAPRIKPCTVCGATMIWHGVSKSDALTGNEEHVYVCEAALGKRNTQKQHYEDSIVMAEDNHRELRQALQYLKKVVQSEYVGDVDGKSYDD